MSAFRHSPPPAKSRGRVPRNAELLLCVAALALIAFAYLAMTSATGNGFDGQSVRALTVFTVFVLVTHLAVRRWAPAADPVLLPCVVLLNGIGLVLIDRLDRAEVVKA
ncbi:FtsW/RodA/SpoVE family cell cycle protein, partial [Nocardia niigatensis]